MTDPDIELPHDVLLGDDFSRGAGHAGDWPSQNTAPVPLDGSEAVFSPLQMGVVHDLDQLQDLLQQGIFRVLPLESTGPLEKSAGHECLVEASRTRTLHTR